MEKLGETNARIPKSDDKIYKDQCIFSFDNPESETGLYVCLNTFIGLGKDFVLNYFLKTGNNIFLHIHHVKNEIPNKSSEEPEKKIVRLAIGVEGGFSPDHVKKTVSIEEYHKIVVLPNFNQFDFPNADLPDIVIKSVEGILKADGALWRAELEAAAQSWDGENRDISKHAFSLKQLNNNVQISSSGWKCEKCEKTDNLWLNLTDGSILCGRKQLDGSGGNNHAVEQYGKTGYPLAVKLGTITADGKADIYSYDEDDMVIDPNLAIHLNHFGIKVSQMEKTEKTMLELEIAYNQRAWEWSRLTESGNELNPKFGPGYTGLQNLGNSCYLNSIMQVLMTIPTFVKKYYIERDNLLQNNNIIDAANDFNIQMCKLASGLLSGRYSKAPLNEEDRKMDIDDIQKGVSPVMFRTLVGKGHSEFSSKKQQDAMEFLEHILKLVTRNARGISDPGHIFKFLVEDKFKCGETGKVKYVEREDIYFPLPVPMDAATNKIEVIEYEKKKEAAKADNLTFQDEHVHSKVPFAACLSKMVASEHIKAFSSAANKEVLMEKTTRLRTFPNFLLIQLVKFGISTRWEPVKYDVSVDMPDELDLSSLKGYGLQFGEQVMPETEDSSKKKEIEVDSLVVDQLIEMGFPSSACKKAVILTGNTGSESALNWIMEHMDDPDFTTALSSSSDNVSSFTPNEEAVTLLSAMGFSRDQACLALKETSNNLERAADWIFCHQSELDGLLNASNSSACQSSSLPTCDGEPKYELAAFVSHMGNSIFVGHYVCHIKKNGEWTIFNDNKVYKSENPPKDLGYIYLYKRTTS